MNSSKVRQTFLDYFRHQNHEIVPSSSLIPENDASLLFANAGMNQFKNTFLGLEPRPYKRAASSQKCVRAGGKHNDLDNVGFTARHHTFFEMLGNFSFGDYFKKDAIHFAWELLTKDFQIPKEKLYVSVFETDDEAADIWHRQEAVPRDRIFRFGEKDNFWRMGDVGPCGPCTEIFFDHGPRGGREADPYKGILAGEDRFVEIWNLVFMQYDEKGPGQLLALPSPSVDTGSGLERLTAALQGKLNNFDTDLFWPLIEASARFAEKEELLEKIEILGREGIAAAITPAERKDIAALRVIADHTRSICLLLADGALPSNEGRGYVLRRILRRAARFSQMLSGEGAFLPELAQIFIQQMQPVFPELGLRKDLILSHVELEQKRFLETLATGLQILDRELQKSSDRILSGEIAFKLYDSSGFPLDLTELIAAERGFRVDRAGFELQMQKARAQSQESWKGQTMSSHQAHLIAASQKLEPTVFVGYSQTSIAAPLLFLSNGEREVSELGSGESGYAIFSETPFYAESGGQVGDVGEIFQASALAQVVDVQKISGHHVLSIKVINGPLRKAEACQQVVSSAERARSSANHSATHLLHAALKKVLGPSVSQAGSLVDSKKTRFDFSFTRSLSREEIRKIEQLVNDQIQAAQEVEVSHSSFKEAVAKGAVALFGEKYSEQVRVLKMGPFSTELCGGTHVKNTSEIRLFVIVSESGVSSGVRRIEAITGEMALAWLKKQSEENLETRSILHQSIPWEESIFQSSGPAQKIRELQERIKDLEKENKKLQFQLLDSSSSTSSNSNSNAASQDTLHLGLNQGQLAILELPTEDRELMAKKADQIRDQNAPSLVLILGSSTLAQRPVVLSASEALLSEISCGQLMQLLGKKFGGKGGGRPGFAQGSLPSSIGVPEIKDFLMAEISRRHEKPEK